MTLLSPSAILLGIMQKKKWNPIGTLRFPDSLEIALLLTLIVFILSLIFTSNTLTLSLQQWGQGLWSLLGFMTQMALVLISGTVLAQAPFVRRGLSRLVKLPRSPLEVYFLAFAISTLCSWVNWGMGLIVGAIVVLECARNHSNIRFSKLAAISYMGFLFWHGGLSGSIPLLMSSKDHFSVEITQGAIPLSQTTFSFFNLSLLFVLFIVLSIWIFLSEKLQGPYIGPPLKLSLEDGETELKAIDAKIEPDVFHNINYGLYIFFASGFLLIQMKTSQFTLDLNTVILFFILLGLLLHGSLSNFQKSFQKGCLQISGILIQYPLYAGIMGLMTSSGLAQVLTEVLLKKADTTTLSLYSFWSAGLVNLLVPSGGGQWAVQSEIVLRGAQSLTLPWESVILAVSWGDAWTNMIQPFWALPLMAVAGVRLGEIYPYCLQILFLSGAVISTWFYFWPWQ